MSPRLSFPYAPNSATPKWKRFGYLPVRYAFVEQYFYLYCLPLGYLCLSAVLTVAQSVPFFGYHVLHVLKMRSKKKMVWAAADGVVAFVTYFFSFLNFTESYFPSYPVSQKSSSFFAKERSSDTIYHSLPNPALDKMLNVCWDRAILVNFFPKSDFQWLISLLLYTTPAERISPLLWIDFIFWIGDYFNRFFHATGMFEFSGLAVLHTSPNRVYSTVCHVNFKLCE